MSTATPATAPAATLPSLVTVDDVRAALKCSRQTVYNLVARGQLHAIKLGSAVRFKSDDVLAFINGGGAA